MILNDSSIAAYAVPRGLEAGYSASKAYIRSFLECVFDCPRGTGVTCTHLAPGPVRTEFAATAGIPDTSRLDRYFMDPRRWGDVYRDRHGPAIPGIARPGVYAVAVVMAAFRRMCMALFAAGVVGANVVVVPVAGAAGQVWNGNYLLLRYASGKTGTSMAASQSEPDFSDIYTFKTDCSTGVCVATVVDGPKPKNPTLPLPPRYTWNGATWVHVYDWQWDCFMGDGVDKVWAPARSVAYYTPQADGTLRGSWRTDIYGGPCNGSVIMDVAAFPAG